MSPTNAKKKRQMRTGSLALVFLLVYCGISSFILLRNGQVQRESEFSVAAISSFRELGSSAVNVSKLNKGFKETSVFGACLLVKDDNKILPEWLAYHYEVLPLRHLVLALDPYCITDPTPILDAFRELGMTVEVWNADRYLDNKKFHPTPTATDEEKFRTHVQRQSVFFGHCLEHLRDVAHSNNPLKWVLMVDSDEYVGFHTYEGPKSEVIPRNCRTFAPEQRQICTQHYNEAVQNGTHPRSHLPKVGEATLASYIDSHEKVPATADMLAHDCIVLPRILITSDNSTDQELRNGVPEGFDPLSFWTLAYRDHGYLQNKFPGKSIVNVRKLTPNETIVVANAHRVLADRCKYGVYANAGESLFRIHHYVGSPQVFVSRPGDTHRTLAEFKKRNVRVAGCTDAYRGWLQAFVNRVGYDKAHAVTLGLRAWAFETDAEISKKRESNTTEVRL